MDLDRKIPENSDGTLSFVEGCINPFVGPPIKLPVELLVQPHVEPVLVESNLASSLSGLEITHVFDNFPDVYAFHLTTFLSFSCRYMFAGLLHQGVYFQDNANPTLLFSSILHRFMLKNIHFIGNCLGMHEDLQSAIDLYCSSSLNVTIDSQYSFNEI